MMMKKEDWLTTFIRELRRRRPDIPRREAHHVGAALFKNGDAAPATAATLASGWDTWSMTFTRELLRLRPTLSVKLAMTISVIWHAQAADSDPKSAAQEYVKSQQRQ
jgi:hypothetical protein